jgi:hypothetical protein
MMMMMSKLPGQISKKSVVVYFREWYWRLPAEIRDNREKHRNSRVRDKQNNLTPFENMPGTSHTVPQERKKSIHVFQDNILLTKKYQRNNKYVLLKSQSYIMHLKSGISTLQTRFTITDTFSSALHWYLLRPCNCYQYLYLPAWRHCDATSNKTLG